ncbi:MAG: hypothetical protein AABY22_15110 [Nanoarchaeota archaeon]
MMDFQLEDKLEKVEARVVQICNFFLLYYKKDDSEKTKRLQAENYSECLEEAVKFLGLI